MEVLHSTSKCSFPSRVGSSDSPSTLGNPNMLQPSSAASWDVLPQTMSVRCGDTSPQFFFVVNFTSTQQMLEVTTKLCSN